ncbi:MAG: hypothetical protein DVB31_03410 [Verrucomicrobia bacterium]|nr:MAG: hypothetical protein DVB31_03410 [Verrucomicrobiota bacterium]
MMPARRVPPRFPGAWLLLAFAVLLCGCAGYRLGPSNGETAGTRSVEFKPFSDQTLEPRLLEPVAQSLRKGLQRDGTFRLATREPGDIVVSGALVGYSRRPLTYQPKDLFTTRDYEVRLVAHVTAVERSTGRVLFDREIVGRTPIRSAPDLNSAERQAAPLLADDLSRTILSLLVDGSW